MVTPQHTPSSRKRAPQQRAEHTRAEILRAATALFTSLGFEGVSLRTIEAHAGVQRGAIAYHFESKDELWRRAIDRVFERFAEHFDPLESTLRDLDPVARLRMAIVAFVRFSAEMPELSRLMVQEGKQSSWRLDYIVDTHMRPRIDWLDELLGEPLDPHTYYIVIGASAMVFDVEFECRRAFGIDPTSDEFIRMHAARIADMILLARQEVPAKRSQR
jgi:AcrR family transcriptional regulator